MKVAFLTSGGLAPCLSSSIGLLISEYHSIDKKTEFIGYKNGYKGLLLNDFLDIPSSIASNSEIITSFGGSFLGNSRVKLTNVEDCIKNKYISDNETPLQKAAENLKKNEVDILHTIGGDDTNTAAADLVKYLKSKNYNLTVVGLPKTVDNDVYPISQTLGAYTAAEQGAIFFKNIVNENTTSSRQLIIHEVMGRNCGWLTAATAYEYRKLLKEMKFIPKIMLNKKKWDIHGIFLPENKINLEKESKRLKKIMDKFDCVNIFLSEGAGLDNILEAMKNNNEKIKYDAFGHVRLDEINSGIWFASKLKDLLLADKVLVQKSGYFSRSAAPNKNDLELINNTVKIAVESSILGKSGVVGLDEDNNDKMSNINFERIKGGKPFDVNVKWYRDMLNEID
tara:strand:+ start:142 stop:1326 length:1185 start_codon:yes stop_codon:yes gene_type:complete